jgi:hypothetical protein
MSVTGTAWAWILLVGLLTSLILPFAATHAAPPVSVTYYLDPGYANNSPGCLSPKGTLNATSPHSFTVIIGGTCETPTMSATYSGPAIAVTNATYTMTGCQAPSTYPGQFEVGIQGPLSTGAGFDFQLCSPTVTPSITQSDTVSPPAASELMSGQNISVFMGFGQVPYTHGGLLVFSGSITITGYPLHSVSSVPEFPSGMLAIFVVALPALLLLRPRPTRRA